MKIAPCPNCGGNNLYRSRPVSACGLHGPNLLPGLGRVFRWAKFQVVLCVDCGLARYVAGTEEKEQVKQSKKWDRI